MNDATPRRAWTVVLGWAAFQLALTSIPGPALPTSPLEWLDVVAHFGLYGLLGGLVARAAGIAGWPGTRLPALWLVLAAGAALDEWHQRFIPGRTPALADWVADLAGAAAGITLGTLIMRSRLAVWLR